VQADLQFAKDVRSLVLADADGHPLEPPDWIILDTPAEDTFYGRAALAAADHVLVPAFAEAFASNGIAELLSSGATIGALRGDVDRWKELVLGCVVTRYGTTLNAKNNLADLKLKLGNERLHLFSHPIPQDDKIETAHRGTLYGKPKHLFQIGSQLGNAAKAYDALAEEILRYADSHKV
jgi:cellulose biosynthesis protein BcsQ